MAITNDFRIGNWVLDAECEPHFFKIEQIRKYVGESLWVYYRKGSIKSKEPEPIELTEDILIKCGLIKNDYSTSGVQYKEPFYDVNLESKGWLINYNTTFGWHIHATVSDYNCVPIKYLHKLQNLYYCLTGKELEIQLL